MAHAQLEEMRSSFALAALARRQDRAEKEQEELVKGQMVLFLERSKNRTSDFWFYFYDALKNNSDVIVTPRYPRVT